MMWIPHTMASGRVRWRGHGLLVTVVVSEHEVWWSATRGLSFMSLQSVECQKGQPLEDRHKRV